MPTEFCTYCDDVHEVMDFGYDFAGNRVLVCMDRTTDAIAQTRDRSGYGELEAEILEGGDDK